MYFDNLQNFIELQGHRSKVKVTWVFVRALSARHPRAILSLERGFYLFRLFLFIIFIGFFYKFTVNPNLFKIKSAYKCRTNLNAVRKSE